jgi:hypothetical protein
MELPESTRIVRVDDLVAEVLEEEAHRMPPSYKQIADVLREAAKRRRESPSTKTVRVIAE